MEHIVSSKIENVGEFEYYLTKTIVDDVETYGVAVKSINDSYIEMVEDIWTEKEPILEFINRIAKDRVTCSQLPELCEEFAEELYSF